MTSRSPVLSKWWKRAKRKSLQARLLGVATDRRGNELGAIFAADVPRHAAREERVRQHVEHMIGRQTTINFQRQTLARVLIGDRVSPERLAGRAIVDEVPGPHVIGMLGPPSDTGSQGSRYRRNLGRLMPEAKVEVIRKLNKQGDVPTESQWVRPVPTWRSKRPMWH